MKDEFSISEMLKKLTDEQLARLLRKYKLIVERGGDEDAARGLQFLLAEKSRREGSPAV